MEFLKPHPLEGIPVEDKETIRTGYWGLYVEVKTGQLRGLWGYAVSAMGKTSGCGCPLIARDCIYHSRHEALMESIKSIEAKECMVGEKMVQKMVERLTAPVQMDLFGGEL